MFALQCYPTHNCKQNTFPLHVTWISIVSLLGYVHHYSVAVVAHCPQLPLQCSLVERKAQPYVLLLPATLVHRTVACWQQTWDPQVMFPPAKTLWYFRADSSDFFLQLLSAGEKVNTEWKSSICKILSVRITFKHLYTGISFPANSISLQTANPGLTCRFLRHSSASHAVVNLVFSGWQLIAFTGQIM